MRCKRRIRLRTPSGCGTIGRLEIAFRGKDRISNSVEATRELCDDLDSLIEIAKQGRAPIRAVSLIERARGDLQAYLDEIHQAEVSGAWSGLG
jgi:hypothetical protein